jgi:hypothetical protein
LTAVSASSIFFKNGSFSANENTSPIIPAVSSTNDTDISLSSDITLTKNAPTRENIKEKTNPTQKNATSFLGNLVRAVALSIAGRNSMAPTHAMIKGISGASKYLKNKNSIADITSA